ncbi:phosphoglycerate kinase [Candidatus Saccharibacteria bacterium]|nr:phosphoglycerate kinase [Candidatus Saccharibacteria bacterium]
MFRKKTIRDIDVQGKVVLVRVDYNVPMRDGRVAEDMRIRASLPTLNYLLDHGAKKLILISHLGRPKGEVNPEFSLAPVAEALDTLLPNHTVNFVDAFVGDKVRDAVDNLSESGILLLENLRFSPLEEENSRELAQAIIEDTRAELFVQDGFAVIHRAHASTDAIAHVLPAVAGFLVENEVTKLEQTLDNPEHPLLVIIGGAKVADKEPLIERFLPLADQIAVGGKIAADGYTASSDKIYVANDFRENDLGAKLDIGPNSTDTIVSFIQNAKTIVWNGALGLVEEAPFAKSSRAVAEAMGSSGAFTIIGGGDTAAFVQQVLRDNSNLQYSLISTGGGASLELLSGKKLPGLEILQDRN